MLTLTALDAGETKEVTEAVAGPRWGEAGIDGSGSKTWNQLLRHRFSSRDVSPGKTLLISCIVAAGQSQILSDRDWILGKIPCCCRGCFSADIKLELDVPVVVVCQGVRVE